MIVDYGIQFNANDIVAKVREVRAVKPNHKLEDLNFLGYAVSPDKKILHKILSRIDSVFHPNKEKEEKNIEDTLKMLSHDLRSGFDRVHGFSDMMLMYETEVELSNDQRLLIENLRDNALQIVYTAGQTVNSLNDSELKSNAVSLEKTINLMSNVLPMLEKVKTYGDLSQINQEYLSVADGEAISSIYLYNDLFSSSFERDSFFLDKDLKSLELNFTRINGAEMKFGNTPPLVQTKVDYKLKVLNNLVSNARRFANKIIIYTNANERNKEIEITVQDNGTGIPPEYIDKIFDEGFSTKKEKNAEHGIGLWQVKTVVEENGGKIWCKSEPGKTEFTFTIPYSKKENYAYFQ